MYRNLRTTIPKMAHSLGKCLSIFLLTFIMSYSLGAQNEFITTWQTTNPGISNSTSISIPTSSAHTYNYDVDWDNDGVFDELGITGNVTHDYGTGNGGIKTIRIQGTFPTIYFNNQGGPASPFFGGGGEKDKIISIDQWGTIAWESMANAFHGCDDLTTYNATDAPDLTAVTDMSSMFESASLFNGDLSTWDVSTVTNMQNMFKKATFFNSPLFVAGTTSNVTNMGGMFYQAVAFNQDLSNWNVSSVTNMSAMFRQAVAFNSPLFVAGTTSNVTNMENMFLQATAFNQDLSNWNVSSVTTTESMFNQATAFNSPLFMAGTTSNVTNMLSMFSTTPAFNQDLSTWNVSSVTTMQRMFYQTTAFDQNLSTWDVSSVANMQDMFLEATAFNQDLSTWDVSSLTDMEGMFRQATAFNSPLFIAGTTLNVTNMIRVFYQAPAFNQDISTWDVSSVTDMRSMFQEATAFNQDISTWDVSSVISMPNMFLQATAFNSPLFIAGTTSSVTNLSKMFFQATSFNQDLSTWDVSSTTNMLSMFYGASAFNQDLSTWNVGSVTNMQSMLDNTNLSLGNYDNTLIGWAAQTVQSNVNLGAVSLNYCMGEAARASLMADDGWIITDAGRCCTIGISTSDICSSFSSTVAAGAGWTSINDANGDLIAAIDAPAGVDLGTVTVELRPSSTIETGNTSEGEIKLLPRYFHLSSSNYPASAAFPSNVNVRIYFLDTELAAMNAADRGDNGVTNHSAADIDITHYFGANQDCDLTNNSLGGNSELIDSPTYASNDCSGVGTGHTLELSVNHFSEFIPHEPAINPLPVDLVSFSGKNEGETNQLFWETASEDNNAGFDIERSHNGRDFEAIGFVEGNGTMAIGAKYEFTDSRPFSAKNYYRLKQIDFDGKYEYSNVIVLELDHEKKEGINIFPNPNNGQFTLTVQNPKGQKAHIRLMDSTGRLLWQGQFEEGEMSGRWNKVFDLQEQEVYFLVGQVGDEIFSEKVLTIQK